MGMVIVTLHVIVHLSAKAYIHCANVAFSQCKRAFKQNFRIGVVLQSRCHIQSQCVPTKSEIDIASRWVHREFN